MDKNWHIKNWRSVTKAWHEWNCRKTQNESIYRKTEELIRNGKWPSVMNNFIRINHTDVTPRLNGRLKDHKLNLSMRPIVSRCIGPVYFIENAFVKLLMSILRTSINSVNSTENLIDNVQNISLKHIPYLQV